MSGLPNSIRGCPNGAIQEEVLLGWSCVHPREAVLEEVSQAEVIFVPLSTYPTGILAYHSSDFYFISICSHKFTWTHLRYRSAIEVGRKLRMMSWNIAYIVTQASSFPRVQDLRLMFILYHYASA